MVKEYKNGLLSSWLAGRPKGAVVEVSLPEGTFLTNRLSSRKELYLFAAGTGFTPMVGVINWARKAIFNKWSVNISEGCCFKVLLIFSVFSSFISSFCSTKISLMFFNRTEKDILLRDELDKLAERDQRYL